MTMQYLIRRIFFVANVLLLLAGIAFCLYALVRLILNPSGWVISLILLAVGLMSEFLFARLYIIRKSKFPLPGIDYE